MKGFFDPNVPWTIFFSGIRASLSGANSSSPKVSSIGILGQTVRGFRDSMLTRDQMRLRATLVKAVVGKQEETRRID